MEFGLRLGAIRFMCALICSVIGSYCPLFGACRGERDERNKEHGTVLITNDIKPVSQYTHTDARARTTNNALKWMSVYKFVNKNDKMMQKKKQRRKVKSERSHCGVVNSIHLLLLPYRLSPVWYHFESVTYLCVFACCWLYYCCTRTCDNDGDSGGSDGGAQWANTILGSLSLSGHMHKLIIGYQVRWKPISNICNECN